jgi:NCS1 family nucleobase:cation symporter-1
MADPTLINDDLAPVPESERTWNKWHIAALWVGMAVCIPTYGLAAALVSKGASLQLAVFSIAIGNLVVLLPLILNGHPGAKYGIPFPVLIRSSFGISGAHVPTTIRSLVACGWFGIQTWIGGAALYFLANKVSPGTELPALVPDFFGISTGEFLAFFAFWVINVVIIWRGVEALKIFETYAAPFLLVTGVALFVWAWWKVGSFGGMISPELHAAEAAGAAKAAAAKATATMSTSSALAIGITGAVAFWGTLALNIPDFTRYAKSQKDQAVGQAISLPTTMTFYVFVGAAVTNATILIFGERIGDPVQVLARVGGTGTVIIAMLGLIIATLSTNLAANVVAPANGFANLAPTKINFRRGAMITAGIGLVIMPWKMWNDPDAYVITWLVGCGGLLGAVGGIMISDYFLVRKTELDIDDLYERDGAYSFSGGFNWVAMLALVVAVAPLVPGFLASLKVMSPSELFLKIYQWSWFVSFLLAAFVYWAGMRVTKAASKPSLSKAPS